MQQEVVLAMLAKEPSRAWRQTQNLLGTVAFIGALTAIPARFGARRPVAEILQAELA